MRVFPASLNAITLLFITIVLSHPPATAEILGVLGSVIAITQLSNEIVRYLVTGHDAGQDAQDYNREVPNFAALLNSLNAHITQNGAQNEDPLIDSVRALQRGPMQQYQAALEAFKAKVAPRARLREKVAKHLKWKFIKDDVKELLARMGRLKNFVGIALQMDHLQVPRPIQPQVRWNTANLQAVNYLRRSIVSPPRSRTILKLFERRDSTTPTLLPC